MGQVLRPISVVVPALNEADNLPLLFKRLDASMRKLGAEYEVLIVDDHSTDNTVAIVKQAGRAQAVRLLTKHGQRGKAFSLLEGFAAAKYDLICMIDADLQYPPEAIPQMYHKMQYLDADIVITQRSDNQTGWLRRLSTFTFNLLFTRLLFGINYDTQSGLKLFNKDILRNIELSPSPWTFDLEFVVRSLEQKYTIVSQEIQFAERNAGTPKIKLLGATLEIVRGSLRLWRNTSSKQIRSQYKHSRLLQSSLLSLAILAIGGLSLLPRQADALTVPVVSPVVSAVRQRLDPSSAGSSQPVDTSKPESGKSEDTAAAKTASAPSTAATPVDTGTSSTATTASSAASTTAPAATSAAADSSSATPVIAGSTPAASTTDTKPAAASPAVQQGKNKVYYPASKLSSNKTNSFLQIALYILLAGGASLLIGLIITGFKSINAQPRGETLRSSVQRN